MIAKIPTASGSSAATIEPNTQTSRISVIGMAIISAVRRSRSIVWVTAALTTASPPAWTVTASPPTARLVERVDERVSPLDRLRLVTLDVGEDERVVAVMAAQRRRIAERPVRDGEVDVVEAADELGDVGAGGAGRIAVDIAIRRRDDEHDVGLDLAERILEHVLGPHRFGTGGIEAAGDEVAGDAAAEQGGGHRQQQHADQREPPAANDERAETSEHRISLANRRFSHC